MGWQKSEDTPLHWSGAQQSGAQQADPQIIPPPAPPRAGIEHHQAHGFAQTFGLHPASALLTVAVNAMIFGTSGVAALISLPTAGASLVAVTIISTICGSILGVITYLAQKKWYGDDHEEALIKSLIVAFLTAIPVGLPAVLAIPAGIIGLFRKKT
jgi:hypothetical protein